MKSTCHSEFGKIQSIFIKPVMQAMVSQQQIDRQWKELNFLAPPDLEVAKREYAVFESAIRSTATTTYSLATGTGVTMDSMYCRDAAIATDQGIILCRMGKEARSGEPAMYREAIQAAGLSLLGEIMAPGTVEGGDVAWVDENTLAVGHTYRTNESGIAQLKALLNPRGIQVWVASMPHYKGPSDVFHLMSVFSPVDRDLAVVYSPLMPIDFRQGLLARGYRLVEVPDAEWDSMGCNVLALSPSNCLMVRGNPITAQRLREAGCSVTEYEGQEISVKGGGGPTCLTRPLKREI